MRDSRACRACSSAVAHCPSGSYFSAALERSPPARTCMRVSGAVAAGSVGLHASWLLAVHSCTPHASGGVSGSTHLVGAPGMRPSCWMQLSAAAAAPPASTSSATPAGAGSGGSGGGGVRGSGAPLEFPLLQVLAGCLRTWRAGARPFKRSPRLLGPRRRLTEQHQQPCGSAPLLWARSRCHGKAGLRRRCLRLCQRTILTSGEARRALWLDQRGLGNPEKRLSARRRPRRRGKAGDTAAASPAGRTVTGRPRAETRPP